MTPTKCTPTFFTFCGLRYTALKQEQTQDGSLVCNCIDLQLTLGQQTFKP